MKEEPRKKKLRIVMVIYAWIVNMQSIVKDTIIR